ncbi:MAG TPA: hypothetical protein VGK19_19595 [Capsulimonadaceae bacterium]|jgi:hypothetical protein
MEEFTNGTSLTAAAPWSYRVHSVADTETICPYCGWVYDQPESVIPEHAACAHLVATAQWTSGLRPLSVGAVAGLEGSWTFWQATGEKTSREAIEHALRRVNVKVESGTATTESDSRDNRIWCRYYFSRRATLAAGELATYLPAEARPTFRPTNDAYCRPCSMHMCH